MKVKTLRSLFNLFVSLTLVVSLAPSFAWAADDSTGGGAVLTTTPQANSTLQKAPAKAPAANTTAVSENAVATIGTTEYSSLDEAIAAAPDNSTIVLQKNVKGYFPITGKTLTIDLNGKTVTADTSTNVYTPTGVLQVQAFVITSGGKVTFMNGTITGANATGYLRESIGGSYVLTYWGGAVSAYGDSDVILENMTITGNKGVVVRADGGTLVINNSKIINNHGESNFEATTGESRGIIYTSGGTVLSMTNTEVSGTTGKNGKAPLYLFGGNATLTSCDIKNNIARDAGGIYFGNNGVLTLNDTTITNNTGTYTPSTKSGQSGIGGIYMQDGTLRLIDSAVYNNTATGHYSKAADILLESETGVAAANEMVDHGTKLEGYVYRNGVTGVIYDNGIPAGDHNYTDDQYDVVKPEDNTGAWQYGNATYDSLTAAVTAYIDDNGEQGEIELLRDVIENDVLPAVGTSGSPVVIDLGGKTLKSLKNTQTTIGLSGKSFVTIKNGTISNGRVGIEVKTAGTELTLSNVMFVDHDRNAILTSGNSTAANLSVLKVDGCEFRGNGFGGPTSTTNSAEKNNAFAVRWHGHFEILNSAFEGNNGGISFTSPSTTTPPNLTNVLFKNNKWTCVSAADTGAIQTSYQKPMTLTDCDFTENEPVGGYVILFNAGTNRAIKLTNCNIKNNTGAIKTVYLQSGYTATFSGCEISGNSVEGTGTTIGAFPVGAIHATLSSSSTTYPLTLYNCIIKDNKATTEYAATEASSYWPTGGVYVNAHFKVNGTTNAIYNNRATAPKAPNYVANDLYLAKNKRATALAANAMTDGSFDFTDYVWVDSKEIDPITGKIADTANSKEVRALTAEPNQELFVARIGETKYKTLEEAFEAAQDGNVIEVIIKEQRPGVKYLRPAAIEIDKKLTLDLKTIILESPADTQFTVKSDGDFTIKDSVSDYYDENGGIWRTGNAYQMITADRTKIGAVNKKISVEEGGSLAIQSYIVAPEIIHNGTNLYLETPLIGNVRTSGTDFGTAITLGKSRYVELGEAWIPVIEHDMWEPRITFTLDPDVLADLNDPDKEMGDVVLAKGAASRIKHTGQTKVNGLDEENANVRRVYTQAVSDDTSELIGTFVLRKDTSFIYIDGVNGKDTDNGTIDDPVKTFEAAVEKLRANEGASGIVVKDLVTVDASTSWDLGEFGERGNLFRWENYTGNLIRVKKDASLTLTNIAIDGQGIEAGAGSMPGDGSLIYVEPHGTLTLGSGSVLTNNHVQAKNAETSCGGAIYSAGNVFIGTTEASPAGARRTAARRAPAASSSPATISDNSAVQGGGIYQVGKVRGEEDPGYTGKIIMMGGTVSHNLAIHPDGAKYNSLMTAGGGIMLAYGADMCFSGGEITRNLSYNIGGGIALGTTGDACTTCLIDSGTTTLSMHGTAVIDDNNAISEGGGIYIQINTEAYVSAGTISYNRAQGIIQGTDPTRILLGTNPSHGGGGIYVNGCSKYYYNTNVKSAGSQYKDYKAGTLYLSDAEIAYNQAYQEGGAYAFCASGDAGLYELHGSLIHDNNGRNDVDITMTTIAHYSTSSQEVNARVERQVDGITYYVSEHALGGVPYDWEIVDVENGGSKQPVSSIAQIQGGNSRIELHTGLTENTTDEAQLSLLKDAISKASVRIVNNSSGAFGGGIGSNGAVVSGYESPKVDVAAEKKWANDTALTANDKRPETVRFILQRKAEGEEDSAFVTIKEAVVNGQEDNWTVKFTDLPEYKEYSASPLPNSEACPDCVNGADATDVKWVYRIVEDETYKPEVDGSLLWKGADATDSKAIADVYKVETKAGDDTERDAKDVPEGYTLNDGVITQKNFTTTNTLKTGELEVAKTVTGDGADANKAFSFTVTLDTKALNNIKLNGTFGDMTFADNEATFALKGGESKTAKGLPAGVSYTVVEADYSADGYTTTKTGDTGTIEADKTASAAFTNYNPGTAAGKLEVEKLLKGDAGMLAAADLPEFTFELVPDDASNPMPKQATVSIKGADFVDGLGTASFDEITFAKAGTYTYTLSEQEPSPLPAGWTYNTEKQKYTVVYDVTDTGTGLSTTRTIRNVTSEQVNKAVFENDFKATPTKETISVEKTVSAGAPDAEFVFRVNPQNGAPEPAGGNECRITGAGSVDFGEITFTQPGEYTYEVEEVATNKAGWTYDSTVYTVTYKVSLNSDAQLVAQRTISKDSEGGVEAITFANTYEQKDGTADGIEVQKKLSASVQPTEKQSFEFLITAKTEGAPMPEANTVSVEGGGTAAFGTIEFSKPGTYTYTVTEVQPNPVPEGYTYDTAEFTVSYTVEDHDAKLVVAKTEITKAGEAASGVEFTNTFAAGPVEESIEVKKIVSGNPDEDETFTFEIEAEEGTTVLPGALQVQVKGAGTASFGPLNFTTTGKFAYIVREVPGANAAYTYDATAYRVEFNVEEQDGKLVATRSTTQTDEAAGGALVFTNTYTPEEPEPEYEPSVPVEVVMIKHLKDALIHEEEFSFGLYNEDGQQQGEAIHTTLGIKTNPQADFYTSYVEIKFAGLSYTEPGVYNYTIREHVDGTTQVVEGDEWNQAGFEPGFYKGGVKYDDKEYPVVVTVVPTANGQLEASVAYPTADGDVHELVNEYNEDYIEIDEFDSHPNDGLHEPEPEETDKPTPTPQTDTTKKDNPKAPTTKPSPKTGSVRTSDTNPVAPLSLLALVAAATAGFAFTRRRNAKGTGRLA